MEVEFPDGLQMEGDGFDPGSYRSEEAFSVLLGQKQTVSEYRYQANVNRGFDLKLY